MFRFLAVTDPLITLLKSQQAIIDAGLDAKIYAASPYKLPTPPWVTVARVGGSPTYEGAPEDYPVIHYRVWGDLKDPIPAEQATMTIMSVLASIAWPVTQGGVTFQGCVFLMGPQFSPDPSDDRAGYVFQARHVCIAADQVTPL